MDKPVSRGPWIDAESGERRAESGEPENNGPAVDSPPSAVNSGADDAQLTLHDWLRRHGLFVLCLIALIALLYRWVGGDGLWNIAKAGLGLSFVIFIHELGHFAVAKWCDVHVKTFSIGFGPALPGCSFQRGETTYKLSFVPLGGYVSMVGEGSEEESQEDDPRSFKNKPVWQRMAIISAGVTMNAILAFVCFILVYYHGKEKPPAVVGTVDAGGPAWEQGIRTGAKFNEIGNRKAGVHPLYFPDLQTKVILTGSGEKVRFGYTVPPNTEETVAWVEPVLAKGAKRPMVGLSPPESASLWGSDLARRRGMKSATRRHSAATGAQAAFAFRPGDTIVAMTDPKNASRKVTELAAPVTIGDPKTQYDNALDLSQRWEKLTGENFVLHVRPAGTDVDAPPTVIRLSPVGFRFGDTIIATTDPDKPGEIKPLSEDPRQPGSGKPDALELDRRLQQLAGQLVTIRVRREGSKEEFDLLVPPAYHYTIGARMKIGPVAALRKDSPAEKARVHKKDVLVKILLRDADRSGEEKTFLVSGPEEQRLAADQKIIDPLRLPDVLRQWTRGRKNIKARLTVRRPDGDSGKAAIKELAEVAWEKDREFDREEPISISAPMAIPELGLAYHVTTTVAEVIGPPANGKNGLEAGDVITAIQLYRWDEETAKPEKQKWVELKPNHWPSIANLFDRLEVKDLKLRVQRAGKDVEVELALQPDPAWPSHELGLKQMPDWRVQKATNPWDAVMLGLDDTWLRVKEVYLVVRGIVTGRIAPDNVAGPITMGKLAYQFAGEGFWEFAFFLGMISINLAVINFFPIPVLDGGHMVFLIYEKIRGKPAPEAVRNLATYAGLFLILSLMLFVIYIDVRRLLQ